MNSTPQIETYLRELARALTRLSAHEREDILAETHSHLAERCALLGEAEALRLMGPPRALANSYLAATGHANPSAGHRLARLLPVTMAVGAVLLWVCMFVSVTLLLAELAEPTLVSIWLNASTGSVFVGAANPDMVSLLTDLAGPWFLPLAGILAVLAGVSGFAMIRAAWREFRSPRGLAIH
ncbi:hypothetical protein AB6B38_00680 [Glycocaulis abyssi]|uniref:DUF1700 domain-containing protein n=1 Tax=Glycocaulis abyssi TaxID=1433403 RepID=A0ABV9N8A7_9PROT